ncbi:hypothetical protein SAMN03159341_104394 [Paenibacillus sp. 1_12]|uniref:hypothetical protein n=1 Tax=Paenibacillus sp. 1_12 TaxID=1566278 RepID=UPI0008E660AC|nr:hypothetical protein [Paenibacillus sp. 1_12]SFL27652.1 hypothetical protein SAMN03159341_104394 [Paenibacillus sp. 1_12]
MTDVWLRTDLKTAGGEVNDIMWNHQCIGVMTLVYREADRITGAVQLEQEVLPEHAREQVFTFVQAHIESLTYALGARTCEVTVSYSELDPLLFANKDNKNWVNVEEDYDYDYDWMEYERFEDENADEQNEYVMGLQEENFDQEADSRRRSAAFYSEAEGEYTVVRTMGSGDTYIFEIYQQSHGGLPIGRATIDASYRQLQGFIDFREPGDSVDRESIAMLMMQEMDKEKDFESFNLIMLYQNQPFEELNYEADWVH